VKSPILEINQVRKSFGGKEVLKGVSLSIESGEFITILGESGSGKTTLLRLIAGFESLNSGEIRMEGERLDSLPPYRRPVNTVFQNYALFPHLSVFENVAYGLRVQGAPKAEIPQRVEKALAQVQMGAFAERSPAKLSGGQQQRVALARALVNRPKILLLDEPLSALDANLRRQMQSELKTLQEQLGITFIFVTHDQEEAMTLSSRIALLRHGRLEQIATPREIYHRPATAYVAEFIGQSNLIRAEVRSGSARACGMEWPVQEKDGQALYSLRPESIQKDGSGAISFEAQIIRQTFEGATDLLEISVGRDAPLALRVRTPSQGVAKGSARFTFSPSDAVSVSEAE
jgi:spermidine/putrescine ABC transporter ATP-binding subunit